MAQWRNSSSLTNCLGFEPGCEPIKHLSRKNSRDSCISNNNVKVYFISMKSLQFAEKYTIQASGDIREIGQKRSGSRKLIRAKLKSAKREPKNISAEKNCHLAKSDLIKR